jgi:hypothetical protein
MPYTELNASWFLGLDRKKTEGHTVLQYMLLGVVKDQQHSKIALSQDVEFKIYTSY